MGPNKGDSWRETILASLFQHSPDSAHTLIPPYTYTCMCVYHTYRPLLTGAPLVTHTTTSSLLSVSSVFLFPFILGAGVSTRASHTHKATAPDSRDFIAIGAQKHKTGPTPQGALNQETEEMEGEPGDHLVLLGDSILFPSQHSTHHGA